jgi:anthranilate/para-aminobenzoate synthase component I
MWSIFWKGEKFVRYTDPVKATVYYLNHSINLLSNEKEDKDFSFFVERIKNQKLNERRDKTVIHLFYEAGMVLNEVDFSDSKAPLAIEVEYSLESDWSPKENIRSLELTPLKGVSKTKYTEDFNRGFEHLRNGDCYQFNLSYKFEYKLNRKLSALDICSRLWRDEESIAPYAHATFIEPFSKLILSNSPECLFQTKIDSNQTKIWTMPIKGTMPKGKDWKESYKKLISSKKDRGELDMITDLLRNDLTRIENQLSRVIKRRAPLVVPKIIHQYSLIASKLSKDVSLFSVVSAMLPGGSITGAPKKRVMEILSSIEKRNRGVYCGSTILFNREKCSASINIRTAEIDLEASRLCYSAGGGITLLSKCEDEFLEMYLKKDSFVRNL